MLRKRDRDAIDVLARIGHTVSSLDDSGEDRIGQAVLRAILKDSGVSKGQLRAAINLVPERQAVESLEPHDNETYRNRSRDIFPPSLIKQVGWERAQSRSERP